MDTVELLKKVRKIEIKIRRLSRHLISGSYHSAFKGRGMSFSEVRQYQFGDDVRAIDWNVTARTGDPYIKIFEEEREQTVMLIVDTSGSTFFGSLGPFKQEILTEICAVLAFSAVANNDKVGLLLYSDRPELYIAPRKGRQHILRIIRELLNVEQGIKGTNLAGAFQFTRNVLKQHSVCFILSDFRSERYEGALKTLAKRHDCVGIHCWDWRERELPDAGLLKIRDSETGAVNWVDTADAAMRRKYTEHFDSIFEQTRTIFKKSSADFMSVRTDQPYTQALLQLFEKRSKLSAHG